MLKLQDMLDKMWEDYCSFNRQAQWIYESFVEAGETVLNDHIALRIFKWRELSIETLAKAFQEVGYHEAGEYHFEQKKLYAKHYEHLDAQFPKIFISELLVDQLSTQAQDLISALVDQVPPEFLERPDLSWAGRPWQLNSQTYIQLANESEYASWVAAHGFRPNHFTVNVNSLKELNSIERVNEFLITKGVKLNSSGGLIKGSPEDLLEQSSTMAEKVRVQFHDTAMEIPACYYEFAKRYPGADGRLYQGFVAKSADKIFESTNAKA